MTDTAQTPKVDAASPAAAAAAKIPRVGSLYVADLDKNITESLLYNFFAAIGPATIASIRVCKDSQSSHSLGYAYANFHKYEDAQKAIDQLNNMPIVPHGPPCRITWSRRDPSVRKSGVGNIFIKNLDKEIDNEALHDAFSSYGEILSCKVAVDSNGVSKGFGFVHFSKPEDSETAIAALNGKCFNGKQVFVGPFVSKAKRPKADAAHFTNIYLKHINPEVTAEQFNEIVAKITADIGKITSPKLMVEISEKDGKQEEKSLRFGFVNFENHETAVKALERFKDDAKVKELAPNFVADDKSLYANRAVPKSQRLGANQKQQNLNLYVKNLSESITDEQLKEHFKEFGVIGSAIIMRNPDSNVSRGFGFVCFEAPEAAAAAINKMNGTKLDGKPLYVAFAQSKEYRARHLAQVYQSRSLMVPQNMGPMMNYGPGVGYYPHPSMRFPGGRNPNPNFRGRVAFAGRPMPRNFQQMPAADNEMPDDAKVQGLADLLFNKLCEETAPDDKITSKLIVGKLLQQCPTAAQTMDLLKEHLDSPEKRATIIKQQLAAQS